MRSRAAVGWLALLLAVPLAAQQTESRAEVEFVPAAPLAEEPTPRTCGLYNCSFNLELGYQQAVVRENNQVYRSHLNYSDGFRVLDFSLRGEGRDGAFFSNFFLEGNGWGGEPANWLRFGAAKENWFDFRATYRRADYFWLFPGFARDEHRHDQQRRLQRYDLTLFPKRPLRVRLGYSRNSSFGLALTTFQFFQDAFVLFEPVRQTYDEYRGGLEWTRGRWSVFFEQSYRFFRNDRFLLLPDGLNPGNVVSDATFLSETRRQYPIRGRIPFTGLTLAGRPHARLDLTARLLYADADATATRFETNTAQLFGQSFQTTYDTRADADRAYTVADGGLTWRPLRKLLVADSFRFRQFSISGVERTEQATVFSPGGTTVLDVTRHRLFELESYKNRIEGRYEFGRWGGVRGGLLYEHRDWPRTEFAPVRLRERVQLDNRSLLLGFQLRPRRSLTVSLDFERGDSTGVFTRLGPAKTLRLQVGARWEPATGVKVSASGFVFDNSNTLLATALDSEGQHRSRNRGAAVDFQWTRLPRGFLNLGYRRNDLSASTSVVFFSAFVLRPGTAVYVVDDNYAYIDFGARLVGKLHAEAGYRVTSLTGVFPPSDPAGGCDPFVPGACENLTGVPALEINRGGVNYHQPHAALRYDLREKVRWKAGWRWYGYNVKKGTGSDYKAHFVTTSLVLSF